MYSTCKHPSSQLTLEMPTYVILQVVILVYVLFHLHFG